MITLEDGLYQRRQEIKVTRSQHGLIIGMNVTAKALKDALAKIPDDARIIDEENYECIHRVNFVTNGTLYVFEVEEKG